MNQKQYEEAKRMIAIGVEVEVLAMVLADQAEMTGRSENCVEYRVAKHLKTYASNVRDKLVDFELDVFELVPGFRDDESKGGNGH